MFRCSRFSIGHTPLVLGGEPFAPRGQMNTRDILFRDAVSSQHIISGVRLAAKTACTNMVGDVVSKERGVRTATRGWNKIAK